MRPQLRLAGRQNYFAILRYFLLDRTLVLAFLGQRFMQRWGGYKPILPSFSLMAFDTV